MYTAKSGIAPKANYFQARCLNDQANVQPQTLPFSGINIDILSSKASKFR